MMFKPSKKVLELWEKYNEAYDAGDLEEYEEVACRIYEVIYKRIGMSSEVKCRAVFAK